MSTARSVFWTAGRETEEIMPEIADERGKRQCDGARRVLAESPGIDHQLQQRQVQGIAQAIDGYKPDQFPPGPFSAAERKILVPYKAVGDSQDRRQCRGDEIMHPQPGE